MNMNVFEDDFFNPKKNLYINVNRICFCFLIKLSNLFSIATIFNVRFHHWTNGAAQFTLKLQLSSCLFSFSLLRGNCVRILGRCFPKNTQVFVHSHVTDDTFSSVDIDMRFFFFQLLFGSDLLLDGSTSSLLKPRSPTLRCFH